MTTTGCQLSPLHISPVTSITYNQCQKFYIAIQVANFVFFDSCQDYVHNMYDIN